MTISHFGADMLERCGISVKYLVFSILLGILINFRDVLTKECDTGFHGFQPLCKKCPYPTYGVKCQNICKCPEDVCSHVTGCSVTLSNFGVWTADNKNDFRISTTEIQCSKNHELETSINPHLECNRIVESPVLITATIE